MDSWQYECCGDPFAVGDRVRWTLRPADLEFLGPTLGALLPCWHADGLPLIRVEDPTVVGRGDLAVVLAPGQPHRVGLLAEEHHGGIPEGAPATTGTVASIRVVRWRTEERPRGGLTWYPVPGSAELEDVAEAEGPGDADGYLVSSPSGTDVRTAGRSLGWLGASAADPVVVAGGEPAAVPAGPAGAPVAASGSVARVNVANAMASAFSSSTDVSTLS